MKTNHLFPILSLFLFLPVFGAQPPSNQDKKIIEKILNDPPHKALKLLPLTLDDGYIIREIVIADIDALQKSVSNKDKEFYKYYNLALRWKSNKKFCQTMLNSFYFKSFGGYKELVIEAKDTKVLVGVIALQGIDFSDSKRELNRIELGYYRLDMSKETKGMMTKAVCRLSDVLVNAGYKVVLTIKENNTKSQKLALSSGFTPSAKKPMYTNDTDVIVYEKDKEGGCKEISTPCVIANATIFPLISKL